MAAAGKLRSERNCWKRVTRIPERRQEEAARGDAPAGQASSASSRSIRARSPVESAIGVVISVPTPASR